MVAINFKTEFVGKILSGEKNCTIRATARCKPGDTIQLYAGMRTKNCRKLAEARCLCIYEINIAETEVSLNLVAHKLNLKEIYQQDGFETQAAMIQFFKKLYGLPFKGYLIIWEKV